MSAFLAGDRWFLQACARSNGGADERWIASFALGILESLHGRVFRAVIVPFQGSVFDGGQAKPTVLAPDLQVRVIAAVEIVTGRHRAVAAVVEGQCDGGGILDVDRLTAHDP